MIPVDSKRSTNDIKTNYVNQIINIEKNHSYIKCDKYDSVIVLPPPNITGRLHIGHALNVFIQDLMVRFERFNGRNILWIPGTDHSGIATQILVEKSIMPLSKYDLGREKFLDKVWEWKEEYQKRIYDQLHSLGTLLNWDYSKFTMDDDLQESVSESFCELYENGLIYKDKKIIYWDTELETAISDLEVRSIESKGKLYYIKYKLKTGDYITVATTRPETMFGDQAIAVNPKDERYSDLIGKTAIIPLTNRKIPIISDYRCDINMGTGAVKITPAHDFLDFEIGMDHDLQPESIFDIKGKLIGKSVPDKYLGIDRLEVRELLVTDLNDQLEKIEDKNNVLPFGDRSNSLLEPRLTEQWFVETETLAKKALEALKEIKIFPEHFISVYKHWMNNIKPWCISRQLWWGHRIPVWYCNNKIIVAKNEDEAKTKAIDLGLNIADIKQDEDVLDTWFSSALWPFVTIENNGLSNSFYPNEFLVTGSDILFFWVARMVMFGCFFKKKVPFKQVYLHGLVQDDFGKKMSKSKNNVIDPISIIEKEGIDVLRFALIYSSIPGKNIKFGVKNIEHSRHFCIKIWNLYKFSENHIKNSKEVKITHIWNLWIINYIDYNLNIIKESISEWDLHKSSHNLYQMIWNTFCNLYLEGVKCLLNSTYEEETKHTLSMCFRKICIALNPFIPYLSSYIFKDLFGSDILNEKWQSNKVELIEFSEIKFVRSILDSIRFCKAMFDVDSQSILFVPSKNTYEDLHEIVEKITKNKIELAKESRNNDIPYPIHGGYLCIPIKDYDESKIRNKFVKIKEDLEKNYMNAKNKIDNEYFMKKAPDDVKEEMNNRIEKFSQELKKVDNIIRIWENSL